MDTLLSSTPQIVHIFALWPAIYQAHEGFYNNELGDTMPIAMANVLGIPLLLITSISGSPLLPVYPRHINSVTGDTLLLTYNEFGPGYYDTAVHWCQAQDDLCVWQSPSDDCGKCVRNTLSLYGKQIKGNCYTCTDCMCMHNPKPLPLIFRRPPQLWVKRVGENHGDLRCLLSKHYSVFVQ